MSKRAENSVSESWTDPFEELSPEKVAQLQKDRIHLFGKTKSIRCQTDTFGYPTPNNKNPLELVVDSPEGKILLWDRNTTLYWRFQKNSFLHLAKPEQTMAMIRTLLGEAILLWGDATPVKFAERQNLWDFEISLQEFEKCNIFKQCVLASAFFPDAGQHELVLYPTLFKQSHQEQIETLAHELGHVFGLRHFFAQLSETTWPSKIFGKHEKFSIMNYGSDSVMTANDRADLKTLYERAWGGSLPDINGTPVVLVRPFHTKT